MVVWIKSKSMATLHPDEGVLYQLLALEAKLNGYL